MAAEDDMEGRDSPRDLNPKYINEDAAIGRVIQKINQSGNIHSPFSSKKDNGTPDIILLEDDMAEITSVNEVAQRRVRRRLHNEHSIRENLRDDFSYGSSSQSSRQDVILLDDNDDSECMHNLLDHESPVNIVNREEQLEDEVAVAAVQVPSRSEPLRAPLSPATQAKIEANRAEYANFIKEFKRPESYCPYNAPHMTVSYLLNCLSMEDLIRNAGSSWNVENLSNEEIRLRIEELVQKEQAGMKENIIRWLLRTKAYSPQISSSISKKSTSAEYVEKCNICMEKYKIGDRIAELFYCPHEFHADCMKQQLLEKNVCPVCRSLAIIPVHLPSWDFDVRVHRSFFK